jgi:hypothetical protein
MLFGSIQLFANSWAHRYRTGFEERHQLEMPGLSKYFGCHHLANLGPNWMESEINIVLM